MYRQSTGARVARFRGTRLRLQRQARSRWLDRRRGRCSSWPRWQGVEPDVPGGGPVGATTLEPVPLTFTVYCLPLQSLGVAVQHDDTGHRVRADLHLGAAADVEPVQPVGSRSQSAGIRRTVPGIDTAVADREVGSSLCRRCRRRTTDRSPLMMTRMRSQGVLVVQPRDRDLRIGDLAVGNRVVDADPVPPLDTIDGVASANGPPEHTV